MLNAVNAATLQTYTTRRNYLCATALTLFVVAIIQRASGEDNRQGGAYLLKTLAVTFVIAIIGTLMAQRNRANVPRNREPMRQNDETVSNVEEIEMRQFHVPAELLTEENPGAVIQYTTKYRGMPFSQYDETHVDFLNEPIELNGGLVHRQLPKLSEHTGCHWTLPLYQGRSIDISSTEYNQHWVSQATNHRILDRTLRLEYVELQIMERNLTDIQVKVIDGGRITRMNEALNKALLPPLIEIVRSYLSQYLVGKIYFIKPARNTKQRPLIASFPYWRNANRPLDVATQTQALGRIKSTMLQNHASPLLITDDDQGNWISYVWSKGMIIARVCVAYERYLYRHYIGSKRVDIWHIPLSPGPDLCFANLFETICHDSRNVNYTPLVKAFNALPGE